MSYFALDLILLIQLLSSTLLNLLHHLFSLLLKIHHQCLCQFLLDATYLFYGGCVCAVLSADFYCMTLILSFVAWIADSFPKLLCKSSLIPKVKFSNIDFMPLSSIISVLLHAEIVFSIRLWSNSFLWFQFDALDHHYPFLHGSLCNNFLCNNFQNHPDQVHSSMLLVLHVFLDFLKRCKIICN